ncbi:MAG: substrate-binding domain-containing protein, partial [Anaerolineae bacterium]|nr:substrate-binding domain-containing protein [Anaerolineae bacterium]
AIPSLTSEQIQGILSGDISQWDEVGGANTTILLYVRDEEEAATQELRKILIGDTAFPTSAVVLTSTSDMITSVAGSSGSIGFGNWPAVLAKQANVSPLMLNEISPTDPTYPLLTIVGLGYDKDKQAEVQPLLDWLHSEEGQARLQTLGMILSTGE